ncbi:MAG: methyltransferase family protein [Erythrobacter sp.]
MSAQSHPIPRAQVATLPESDVSTGVGLAGLLGLAVWILFCRNFPTFAEMVGMGTGWGVLSGPYAAITAMAFTAGPMALWSVLVDKVHLRPTTGLDWSLKRSVEDVLEVSTVKIVGLWATWLILAGLYCLCRWYWDGQYLFAMDMLGLAIVPMVVLSVPYVIWLDRHMVDWHDSTWHFGAALLGRGGVDGEQVKKHWRAWIIKAFFGAFMISILPPGFAFVVEADPGEIIANPVEIGMLLITLLFLIDVQIGAVGYLFTLRPLDAHIRSGNPFVAGWLAALLCYPPFVWGIIGNNNQILSYEANVEGWGFWMQGQPALLWVWAVWLVFLTAIYAWATVAFGIRFSNLTYRGVLTNGPYRYTRHPAYLSKNLFWWCSVLPFLVTSGSATDAIRNTFFLLVVNAIYYWRARTEEAHLLAEDRKYREYYDWMEANGLVTAPLAALKRRLLGRFSGAGSAASPDIVREPAE